MNTKEIIKDIDIAVNILNKDIYNTTISCRIRMKYIKERSLLKRIKKSLLKHKNK